MPKASAKSPSCPSCDEAMESGFVCPPWPMGPQQVSRWVKGRPMTPAVFGTKPKGRQPLVVTSWRCRTCGRLESFAN